MLYIVATPIGNIKEITLRATEVLKSVDIILCEDTRHSLILLREYGIEKPLISYQKFSEKEKAAEIIEKLKNGLNIALISDAGMPLISDPGSVLVRAAIENNLEYTVVSGPCALINALVLSGMDTSSFYMGGFLRGRNIDRQKAVDIVKDLPSTLIFYSAPHDVIKDLQFLFSRLGSRRVSIVREISKIYEEVIVTKLGEIAPFTEKGEFVLVIEGASGECELNALPVKLHIKHYMDCGFDKKEAVKKTAADRGVAKSEIYKQSVDL